MPKKKTKAQLQKERNRAAAAIADAKKNAQQKSRRKKPRNWLSKKAQAQLASVFSRLRLFCRPGFAAALTRGE
jgi:hypothetical protein